MANEVDEQQRPRRDMDYRIHIEHSFDSTMAKLLREIVAGLVNQQRQLNRIERSVGVVREQGEELMANISQLEAEVSEQTTVHQSAITLLENLSKMVKEAGTDPVKLEAIVTQLSANRKALADAVTANTPSEGEEEPPTPA